MHRIPAPIFIIAGGVLGVIIARKTIFSRGQVVVFNRFLKQMTDLHFGYLANFFPSKTGIITLIAFVVGCALFYYIRKKMLY